MEFAFIRLLFATLYMKYDDTYYYFDAYFECLAGRLRNGPGICFPHEIVHFGTRKAFRCGTSPIHERPYGGQFGGSADWYYASRCGSRRYGWSRSRRNVFPHFAELV